MTGGRGGLRVGARNDGGRRGLRVGARNDEREVGFLF